MARKVNQLSEVKLINDNDSFLIETSSGSRQVKGVILKRLFLEAKLSIAQFDPNKGKITANLLDDSVLEMIAGNAPVNPTIEDYSITHNKLALGNISVNNFDENIQAVLCEYIESDKQIEYSNGSYKALDGSFQDGVGFSKKIKVEPSETILVTANNSVVDSALCVFFDKEDHFISSFTPTNNQLMKDIHVLVPQNCYNVIINTADKDSGDIKISRLSIINYADKFRDLNTKVEEYKKELDATDLNLEDRISDAETKLDDIGNFQDTRDYLKNLDIDNEELEKRVSNTEEENPFDWKQFDKAQVVFMIDAGNPDLPEVYNIFKNYNIPVSFGVPSSFLNNKLSNKITLKETLKGYVKNDGCEVLSQSIDSNVFMQTTTEEEAEKRLRLSKLDLMNAGFDINGFVKPMGEGSLSNLEQFEHLVKRYYRYGILSGKSEPFNITRVALKDSLSNLKNKIEETIMNETFIVFYCSSLDTIDVSVLNSLIQHILIKKEVKVTTLNNLYNNYRSTTLANKIAAGIDIGSLLEVNQVKNEDHLVIETENGPKKISKSNFDNVIRPFDYGYNIWYPSNFPKLPFRVFKNVDGHYKHEFNIDKEFIGYHLYVSCKEEEGSDTNTGTTPDTCLVNLSKAIEVANKSKYKNIVINVLSNLVDLNKGPLKTNFKLEKNIVIKHVNDEELIFTSAPLDLEWEDFEGIYRTYQTYSLNIRDRKYRDLDNIPLRYKPMPTINQVKETPGSYFISDTNYVYVNTIDERHPDTDILVNTSCSPSEWNISDHKLVFSNITFMMNHTVDDQVKVIGNENSTLISYKCKFVEGGNHGLFTNKVGKVFSFDCISCEQKGTGFYYKSTLEQGQNDLIFEFNCKGYNNGKLNSGVQSMTAANDGVNIIRINSNGHSCDGPICCDKNGCRSLMYGCTMCNSTRGKGNLNTGFWFDSELSNKPHQAYLIDCAGDSEYSLNADIVGFISVKNFKGIKIPEPIKRIIDFI